MCCLKLCFHFCISSQLFYDPPFSMEGLQIRSPLFLHDGEVRDLTCGAVGLQRCHIRQVVYFHLVAKGMFTHNSLLVCNYFVSRSVVGGFLSFKLLSFLSLSFLFDKINLKKNRTAMQLPFPSFIVFLFFRCNTVFHFWIFLFFAKICVHVRHIRIFQIFYFFFPNILVPPSLYPNLLFLPLSFLSLSFPSMGVTQYIYKRNFVIHSVLDDELGVFPPKKKFLFRLTSGCAPLFLLRYGKVIRFPFLFYTFCLSAGYFVLSSGWLASYSGSVGSACINNYSLSVKPFTLLLLM